MNRTKFYTVFVMAVLLAGAIVYWHSAHKTADVAAAPSTANAQSPKSQASASMANSTIDSTHTTPEQAAKVFENKFGITSNTTPEEAKQKVLDWYLGQAQKLAERDRHPIVFYGQTVDESNQPLTGVNVHFSLNGGLLVKDLLSDANGYFYISDLVGKLLVIDVSKAGYYTSKSNQISFDYTSYRPNPLQPEIFHLRKKGEGADLISAVLNVQFPRDGTSINVNFLNKSFGASGQMKISQMKPPYESWKTATKWSFGMEIADGGFVEENQEFPFEAAISGYQPAIKFDFEADQPDWKTRLVKSYYFTFGSPLRYGQMKVETDIMWGGARISYAINPTGSRNLEPKSLNQ